MAGINVDITLDGDDEAIAKALNTILDAVDTIPSAKVEGFKVVPDYWVNTEAGTEFAQAWATRPPPPEPPKPEPTVITQES